MEKRVAPCIEPSEGKPYSMMVEGRPKVAVLMAAYNGIAWISEQVDSILRQEHVDISLFISVDKSNDGTGAWVRALCRRDSRVTLLSDDVKFGSAGKNFFYLLSSLDLSTFDAVAFSDQDDIWHLDKIQRSWRHISGLTHAAYSSNVVAFWPSGRQKMIDKAQPKKQYDHFFEAAGPGCTYMITSEIAIEIKEIVSTSPDAKQVDLHDWFIYAYCRSRGYYWYIDQKPTLYYRQHESNHVGANNGLAAYRKRIKLISSGWYRQQVECIVKLIEPDLQHSLCSRWYLIKNFFRLRRKVIDSFFLLVLILLGRY